VGRRGAVAIAVLAAWAAGMALFARRELSDAPARRLADAGLRVAPGAEYYAVEQNGTRIGYASSTIDTLAGGALRVTDFLLADIPVGGRVHRTTAQSVARVSRALALTDFSLSFESDSAQLGVKGRVTGDSLLEVTVSNGDAVVDTRRVRLDGPLLLPTLLPLAVALGERPEVGRSYTLSSFDPLALAPRPVRVRVLAESVFVVADSAAFDSTRSAWRAAHRDTVRAWLVAPDSLGGVRGWVDEHGRIVRTSRLLGFDLTRTAFELAFEEWRRSRPASATVASDRDILETTAIAASRPLGARRVERLTVRLGGVSLAGYELQGNGQRLHGDTLDVARVALPDSAPYDLGHGGAGATVRRDRALALREGRAIAAALAPEPLVQSGDPRIVALAGRIAGDERDPREVARRINRWVHDSLAKRVMVSVPSAVQVLERREGDCNEHTQLFVALARAAHVPARTAAGLAYVDGKFYYHAWPEVWLGAWVPVDPTFGQFPADAAHLRFVRGGLARQAELLRLVGQLKIEVIAGGR
jgi:transglutaminase-like putative cysteine protease